VLPQENKDKCKRKSERKTAITQWK
jgi:hypothetical protein